MSGSPPRAAGFTLLELMLVLVLVAALAGAAAVAFGSGSPGRSLDHSAVRLVAALRYCRQRSVMTGRRHRLAIAPAGDAAWVEDEVDPLDDPGLFEPSPGPWGRQGLEGDGVLDGRVRVVELALDHEPIESETADEEELGAYVYFEPTGRARDLRLVLEIDELSLIVRLRGLTGRARVVTDEEDLEDELDLDPAVVWVPELEETVR